jgi:hypothetical protein
MNFKCQYPKSEGTYSIFFEPTHLVLPGPPVEIALRVLKEPPPTPPAPNGWMAVSLTLGIPDDCRILSG